MHIGRIIRVDADLNALVEQSSNDREDFFGWPSAVVGMRTESHTDATIFDGLDQFWLLSRIQPMIKAIQASVCESADDLPDVLVRILLSDVTVRRQLEAIFPGMAEDVVE